jgi:hypothetical protein
LVPYQLAGTGFHSVRYQWARTEEFAMSLFKKKDDHAGSGIDKPEPKGIVKKVVETVKSAAAPKPPPKSPATP